jgi:hypothetical protein
MKTDRKFNFVAMSAIMVISACCSLNAQVLFQDNFNSTPDWTIAQQPSTEVRCFAGYNSPCSPAPPQGWSGYYNGMSYMGNAGYGVGYNNMYINTIPGYPFETSGTCRGGSGKCLTFWDEAASNNFVNSDGQLYIDLGQEYQDIYYRFFFKFGRRANGSPYSFTNNQQDYPQHKLFHLQHFASGAPWQYFHTNEGNQPVFVGGLASYAPSIGSTGDLTTYSATRCYSGNGTGDAGYYCQGTPTSYGQIGFPTKQIARSSTAMNDGNWHSMEVRLKMNTFSGTTFRADGIYSLWIDGVQIDNYTNAVFSQNGAETNPVRGFRVLAVGGNSSFHFPTCTESANCEQWYAIDDIVVSTQRIGSSAETLNPPANVRVTGVR